MNNNLLISLLILTATSVTIITCTDAGGVVQITKSVMDEKPYECTRNLTLTCKFITNRTVVVWMMSNDRRKIAECSLLQHKCSLNPDYIGQYDISADLTRDINFFNLTLIQVTMQDNRRKLVCSDGSSSDSHVIKVTGTDIAIQQTIRTDNRNPVAYGKNLTLTCLFTRKFAVVWRYADKKNIAQIAECMRNKCTLNPHYAEQYKISSDMRRCMFNLTIRKVVAKNNGQKLMCSDGSYSDYYIIRVKDYRPRVKESPNTITATSACVSKEMNVSFKWLKICANDVTEKEINLKFRDKYTTSCSNLSTFGNDQDIHYTERVPAIPSNEGNCSLKVLAMYDNEEKESSTLVTNYTIIEEQDYKDEINVDVRTEPNNVAVPVIVCLVIIIIIAVTLRWTYVCYQKQIRKQSELPGKQDKKTDVNSPISAGAQANVTCSQDLETTNSKDEELIQLLPPASKSKGDLLQEPKDDDMSDLRSTGNHSRNMPESKYGEYSFTTQADIHPVPHEEFKPAKEYTATGPVKFPVASENDRKESYSNNLKVRSRQILPVVQEINEKGDCSTEQPIEIGRHKEQDAHINHMIKDVSEKVINDKIKNVSEKGLHITNPQNVEDLLTNDKTENMPTDETTAKKDMNYSDHQIPNVLKTDKTVDLPKHPHEVENNDTEKILVARKCGGINHHSSRNVVMNVEEENMPSPNTQSGFKNVGTGLEKESKIQTQIYEARKS